MKKPITFLSLLLIAVLVTAQAPHRMSYQSVIRDADNNLVANQEVGMQISILQGAADGTAVYVERHFPATNANGLVSLEIGGGTEISGSFEQIDWGADIYFIKTETDLQGGENYAIAGVSQVLSVPYALHAKTAETATEGLEETDPVFMASPAAGIEATHIDNWEEAFSWGDHDGLYHSIDWNPAWDDIEDKPDLADLADVATSGSYEDLIDTPELNLADWNEAYSWGDHALAGYLTDESDPLFAASPAADIEDSDMNNWNAAFAWGDHAAADYITDETDPLFTASPAADIEDTHIDNWDEAYSWGDHAEEGYLTGEEDAVIHGLTVGRGSGAMESNTALGIEALIDNTTGEFNTATGAGALHSNTTGGGNTATGFIALTSNETGNANTALGYWTLASNTGGENNTAVGTGALFSNETGDGNTALGFVALQSNKANSGNTAIGYGAMQYADNTTDGNETFNTALGYQALRGGTPATNNTGAGNTALGGEALAANTSGTLNTASGFRALFENTEGGANTAFGAGALGEVFEGDGNTAIGYLAGSAQEEVNNGTFLGAFANATAEDLTNVAGVGYFARPTANNMIRIGNTNVTSIGGYASWTVFSDERYKHNLDTDVAGLDFIMKLRPVTYNLEMNGLSEHLGENKKVDEEGNVVARASESQLQAREERAAERYTGFVAQEVEAAARAIGYDFSGVETPQNEESLYGLRYAEFVVPLVKAVQEQQDMIDSQQDMIKNQQQMIQVLQEELEALQSSSDQ